MRLHISKAAVALLAALLAIGLFAPPAHANTVTLGIDSGTIDIYNAGDTLVDTITLGGTNCGESQVSVTATGSSSGTITGTLSSTGSVTLLGTTYVSTLTATLTGTYTGSGSAIDISATASITLDPSVGTTAPCTKDDTIDCSIAVGGIALSGTTDATLPTFETGDLTTLNGGSDPFSILVSTGCPGPISAINDGYLQVGGLGLGLLPTIKVWWDSATTKHATCSFTVKRGGVQSFPPVALPEGGPVAIRAVVPLKAYQVSLTGCAAPAASINSGHCNPPNASPAPVGAATVTYNTNPTAIAGSTCNFNLA